MTGDIQKAIGDYSDVTGTPASGISKIADDLSSSPEISGDKYLNMRSQLGKTAQSLRFQDPAQSAAYGGVQDALDDAMERGLEEKAQAGDQQAKKDLGAFQDVRSKYQNLVAIEKAAGSAGADAANGILSPQQMRTAIATGNNRRAYARGIGDLAPLTNAGNAIMTNVPQSGTAPRLLAAALLHGVAGPGLGLGAVGGIPGAIAGTAVPAIAGRTIMSAPAQGYLANQFAPGIGRSPALRPLAAALAAYGGGKAAQQPTPDAGVQTGGGYNR
jgi:hypothetical protein